MDQVEAKWVLMRSLGRERRKPYSELSALVGQQRSIEVAARSGRSYQLELQWYWDSDAGGDIRILGSIDDGGLRTFMPMSYGALARREPAAHNPEEGGGTR